MKKIINHAKQNPFDVIIPAILAVTVITMILCLVFSNGNLIAHFSIR